MRTVVRLLHRVLGLGAGSVLVVLGLSGSALVFRYEIDRALNPALLRVAPAAVRAPLQPVLDQVARRYPGEPVTRVRMPPTADGTYELWLGAAPTRYVYVDPYRGTILGARRPTEFLTGWLFLLHSHLLAGRPGQLVAGVAALMLMALSVSGLLLCRPRHRPWRLGVARLRPESGSPSSPARWQHLAVHRTVGFWASLLLLVGGLTGASLAFPDAFQRAAFVLTASRAAPGPPAPSPTSVLRSVDALVAVAERTQPGGTISYLYLPTARGESFRVRQRLPGELHPTGKSFVHLDPATGAVLGVEDGTRAPRGARFYSVLYPLHTGVAGGLALRLVVLLSGLALPLLAVTGVMLWWRRTRRSER